MQFQFPKNNSNYIWTNHVVGKMRYYGLTESKIKKVLLRPERTEMGIAPRTIAAMNTVQSKNRPHEIWVMYQLAGSKNKNKVTERFMGTKKVIISAWRYPGRSPIGKKIEIPQEVLDDLRKFLTLENLE